MEIDKETLRINFVKSVSDTVNYWNEIPKALSQEERLNGVAFSILCLLDGVTAGEPQYALVPFVEDEEDGEFYGGADIAGELHDLFYPVRRGEYDEEEEITLIVFDISETTIMERPGVCPVCGSDGMLDYGDSGINDESYYYCWTCEICGSTGKEWCDLVFSEHIVDN